MIDRLQTRPQRRCQPKEEWPPDERARWEAAQRPGSLLDEGGCRSRHSAVSNRNMARGWGRWKRWDQEQPDHDDHIATGKCITPARLRAYATDSQKTNALPTVIARLIELKVMAGIMAPDKDWSWIYRIASLLRARSQPARPKRNRLVSADRLWSLGLDLMQRAEKETTPLRCFKAYRDGLIIAVLAARVLRLANLTGLILGRTLVQRGEEWWIEIPAIEVKTRTPIEVPWPRVIIPHLEVYLSLYRPWLTQLRHLRPPEVADALWLTMYGQPMHDHAIYIRIIARTRQALGHAINPHLFRDCAATSIAIEDPAHVRVAAPLLQHRTFSTTEKYYNQAQSLEASRTMQRHLLTLRRSGKRTRARRAPARG